MDLHANAQEMQKFLEGLTKGMESLSLGELREVGLRGEKLQEELGLPPETTLPELVKQCESSLALYLGLVDSPVSIQKEPERYQEQAARVLAELEKVSVVAGQVADLEPANSGKAVREQEKRPNLTIEEIAALEGARNLADGHAYRAWSESEQAIIDRSGEILTEVDRKDQRKIEREYLERFFELGEQTLDLTKADAHLCFTASMGLEVVGNYLRMQDMSVALLEPCFDNLADILKRHEVKMVPVADESLSEGTDSLIESLRAVDTDAVFLVLPNCRFSVKCHRSILSRMPPVYLDVA